MTVLDNGTRNQYTATSSQTGFVYDFEIIDDDDIIVDQNGSTLTKTTHYTVSGAGDENGGNVTLVTGATSGDIITLYRRTPRTREADFVSAFTASEINSQLDKIWLVIQELENSLERAVTVEDNTTSTLPINFSAPVIGNFLKWTDASTVGNSAAVVSGGGPTSVTVQIFTSSDTYTPTSGTVYSRLIVQAAGGGGGFNQPSGHAGSYTASSAGGGGSAAIKYFIPSGTYTVTVGSGGPGGLEATQTAATAGGNSSFVGTGVNVVCNGGGPGDGYAGATSNASFSGSGISTATGGDINLSGGSSGDAFIISTWVTSSSVSGASPVFGGGLPSTWESAPTDASQYGEGGGASAGANGSTAFDGGDGGDGVVIVFDYVNS